MPQLEVSAWEWGQGMVATGPAVGGGLHGDELEGWASWPGLSWQGMRAKGREPQRVWCGQGAQDGMVTQAGDLTQGISDWAARLPLPMGDVGGGDPAFSLASLLQP